MISKLRFFWLPVLACAVLAACSHYQLGTGSQPKFSRIFIGPVKSEALIPQAQALVTTELREAFIKDGRVAVTDSEADADASLQVTLVSYQRSVTVAQTQDTGLARRFDITLQAKVTLTDLRTGKPFFADRILSARRGVFTDSGQQQAEYQTLPLLAGILAQDTLHASLDTW